GWRAQVWLNRGGRADGMDPRDMASDVVAALVTGRQPGAGGDRGFDDEVLPLDIGNRVTGFGPDGGDDRHARGREIAEIALVGVPAQDRRRVDQPGPSGGVVSPGEEPVPVEDVVPRAADERGVER